MDLLLILEESKVAEAVGLPIMPTGNRAPVPATARGWDSSCCRKTTSASLTPKFPAKTTSYEREKNYNFILLFFT